MTHLFERPALEIICGINRKFCMQFMKPVFIKFFFKSRKLKEVDKLSLMIKKQLQQILIQKYLDKVNWGLDKILRNFDKKFDPSTICYDRSMNKLLKYYLNIHSTNQPALKNSIQLWSKLFTRGCTCINQKDTHLHVCHYMSFQFCSNQQIISFSTQAKKHYWYIFIAI